MHSDDGWEQAASGPVGPGSAGVGGGGGGRNGLHTGFEKLDEKERRKVMKNAETLNYYHYRLHRSDVEAMLLEDGDFILRKGTRNNTEGLTVSARWHGRLLHFPVQLVGTRCCFEAEAFSFVQNLIHYHVTTGQPVTIKSGCKLIRAKGRVEWELLERSLAVGRKLGAGAFGAVYEATWHRKDFDVPVAVKTLDMMSSHVSGLKCEEARLEMLREARIMRELSGHPNLVRDYGVTIDRELPYAVMELMDGGSLLSRLRREDNRLSVQTRVRVLLEVARGLSYFARSGYVHRDVSARNMLYNKANSPADELGIVKITDFGLARKMDEKNMYKAPEKEGFPVKWTAPESIVDRVWSYWSDVWGMAVLMWEVFSDGAQPYCDQEQCDDADFLVEYLKSGNRMTTPTNMPRGVENLMNECWAGPSCLRPAMWYVCWKLRDELLLLIK